ncbi:MAG: hypothetical protein M1818_003978 [Claussenomyces sp. TS43310]|nr:MAG: hypothetical protein M1818_003978 [Claussenomyces sp. TS43310]
MYSNNVVVPSEHFKLESGTPKTISKTADSGKQITNYFCPECGTTLYRIGETFGAQHIIKSGVLDDPEWHRKNPPKGELYAPDRLAWISKVDGAQQVTGMGG